MHDGYLAILAIVVMIAIWVLILCSKKNAVEGKPLSFSRSSSRSGDGGYPVIIDGGTTHQATDCSPSDSGSCSGGE